MSVTLPGTGVSVASESRVDGNYQKFWHVPFGTQAFDSEITNLPTSIGALTTSTIYVSSFYFQNGTDEWQAVTLTDTAGFKVLDAFALAPRSYINETRRGAKMIGIKWFATPGVVTGQVTGWS